VSALVKENEQVKSGGRSRYSNSWADFNARELAKEAVGEAASLLNADTVKSGEYRVASPL